MFDESIYDALEGLNRELTTRNFETLDREGFIADSIQKILNRNYIPDEEYAF